MTQTTPSDDRRELLRLYLADHRAGSVGGISLARRMASSEHRHASQVKVLEGELNESQHGLDRIMSLVGAQRSAVKDAVAAAGERLGRLKSNGRFVRRSPLSDVVELELLACGLAGQRQLWRALSNLGDELPAEARSIVADRSTVVEDQIGRVDAWHQEAVLATAMR